MLGPSLLQSPQGDFALLSLSKEVAVNLFAGAETMTITGNIGELTIIGAGAMGSAFAKGLINAGLVDAASLTVADVDTARLKLLASEMGVNTTSDNAAAVRGADVVLLAVKPAIITAVLLGVAGEIKASQLIVSIAAGVKLQSIESALPEGTSVIRAMPNTPSQIGVGATGFSRGKAVTDAQAEIARTIFDAVGLSVEVPEKSLDAVTGLSGSGPAYVYLMIEALSDAGVRVGLTRDVSVKLAAQTVMGAARMVLETGDHPAQLKDRVASPGGTTIAGIDALESAGFRSALISAVKAATKRSEELG